MALPLGVEVRTHPTKGKALYATQPYAPGAHIFTVPPLICLPLRNNVPRVCAHCLTVGEPRGCSRCHHAYYCDAACQKAGWKIHGKECKALTKLYKDKCQEPPTPVRAIMQALLIKEIGDKVNELEGNFEQWWSDEKITDFNLIAAGAVSFSFLQMNEENVSKALDFLFKIQTNSFQSEDEHCGQVGVFLEPTLARINHSCVPNAFVHLSKRNCILRAEAPILAGQEIEISYCDDTHPLSLRRKALETYKFECQCPRCNNNLNVYQTCAVTPSEVLDWPRLVTDPTGLRDHPAVTDKRKIEIAKKYGGLAADLAEYPEVPDTEAECHAWLMAGFQRIKPLADEELWAVAPMPQLLNEAVIHYNRRLNYPYGLYIACFIAVHCDPYRFPAPFASPRSERLFLLVKSMLNISSDIEMLKTPIKQLAKEGGHKGDLGRYLGDIDLVSLAHMILIMLLGDQHGGVTLEEQNTEFWKQTLRDMDETPGREQEKSIMKLWRTDPTSNMSRNMWDFTVVKQIEALARLGRAAIRRDFNI